MTPRAAYHLKTTLMEDHAFACLLPSHAEHADFPMQKAASVAAVSEAGAGRWAVTVNGSSTLAGETGCSKIRAITFPFCSVVAPVEHFNKQELNKNVKEDACKQGQLED